MARSCHRQESAIHLIFVGEQFWGRAARASWTRKSSRTLVIFAGIWSSQKVNLLRS